MFVGSENVNIEIFYRKNNNGTMKVLRDLEGIAEMDKAKFKKVVLEMKPLTWKKYNDLQRSSLVSKGPVGADEIDWYAYKEKKIVSTLVGWDAKDDNGKPIPVSPDNIFKLHPMIVEMALNEFDRMTLLGEEERKNS